MSLMVFTLSAQEYDETRYANVVKQLNLDPSKVYHELYTEKKMPNSEYSYIIVIPVVKQKVTDDYFLLNNYILITDENGLIKTRYLDTAEITSDAIMLQSFTIDTGLYNLTSNIRAFGVVANYTGSSRPNPYSSSKISIYYPYGKILKKVLSDYDLYSSGGEWDMSCTGQFYENRSVIILDQAKNNGFANLKIKTISTETISKEIDGECSENKTSKTSYKILRFNKSVYK